MNTKPDETCACCRFCQRRPHLKMIDGWPYVRCRNAACPKPEPYLSNWTLHEVWEKAMTHESWDHATRLPIFKPTI